MKSHASEPTVQASRAADTNSTTFDNKLVGLKRLCAQAAASQAVSTAVWSAAA
jgi:hypothetical protein